jgi:uncharacterized protein (DUF305 family)
MFSKRVMMTAILAAGVAFASVHAEDAKPMDHSKMGHGDMGGMMDMGMPKGDQGPSSMAFAKANATMHEGMDIEFSGNTDVDFVKGMIAHHQGAIDMAKIQLQYGKDEKIKALSEGIIKAQEGEIAMMKEWLAANGQ